MSKWIQFSTQIKKRLGLRGGGSLNEIREEVEDRQQPQVSNIKRTDQVERSTNSNNMDSGNASAPLSPTLSATSQLSIPTLTQPTF